MERHHDAEEAGEDHEKSVVARRRGRVGHVQQDEAGPSCGTTQLAGDNDVKFARYLAEKRCMHDGWAECGDTAQ